MMQPSPDVLDRRVSNPFRPWILISAIVILFAVLIRLLRLDVYLLSAREGQWSYNGWALFYGTPAPPIRPIPNESPVYLLLNAAGFAMFGVTDAVARLTSAVAGIGLVLLPFLLRPLLTRGQAFGIALLLAVSPTMVFAARTAEPPMLIAFFGLLTVVAVIRAGIPRSSASGWSVIAGVSLALLYGSGSDSIITIIALGVMATIALINSASPRYAWLREGLRAITGDPKTLGAFVAALVVTLVLVFSRGLSDLAALQGIGTTMTRWLDHMSNGVTPLPGVFFLWAIPLYETVAVVLAIITVVLGLIRRSHRQESTQPSMAPIVAWFVVAVVLHSFSATREPSQFVLIVLPLLLIAGPTLGNVLEGIERGVHGNIGIALLVLAFLAFGIWTTFGLAFVRGDDGTEPLARGVPSAATRDFVHRADRLSRDLSSTSSTSADPAGRYSLHVVLAPEQQYPFSWYFRNQSDVSIASAGAYTDQTDIAIANNADGMETAGLTAQTVPLSYRPTDGLARLNGGRILRTIVNPANWDNGFRFMLNRDVSGVTDTRTVTVGYSNRVITQLYGNVGPHNLWGGTPAGPGDGLGQLNQPMGIATGSDGTIYVVNAANARIDRYSADGTYLGVWDGRSDPSLALSWNQTQGATGVTVDSDGRIYIADTWNHAVVVLSPAGDVIQVLGQRGTVTQLPQGASPSDDPGLFFGPRGVAAANNRVYVTDTGNSRVQVFSRDGTFQFGFGGLGTGEGKLQEPTGIAAGPDGTIWVADSGNGRVQQFDADGNFLRTVTMPGWQDQQGIYRLNFLTFCPDGLLYSTSPIAGVQATNGDEVATVTSNTAQSPTGISCLGNGQLLVVDSAQATVNPVQPMLSQPLEPLPAASPTVSTPEVGTPIATPLIATPTGSPQATPAASPSPTPGD